MDNQDNKSLYEQQEDKIREQSEAFIGLLTKRGILGDRKINDEKIRAAQQEKRKKAYHNTEMLLKNYRLFIWVITCAPQEIAEELDKQYETLDEIINQLDFELAIGNQKAENRIESVMNSRVLIKRLDEALTVLKNKPGNGKRLYDLIYLTYIAPEKLSHVELLYQLNISSRQYYRLREQAISILAIRLWSAPTSNVDFWLEILTLLDKDT